jgi:hypothetical protein
MGFQNFRGPLHGTNGRRCNQRLKKSEHRESGQVQKLLQTRDTNQQDYLHVEVSKDLFPGPVYFGLAFIYPGLPELILK